MACGEAACKRVVTGARLLVLYSGRRGLSWKNLSVCLYGQSEDPAKTTYSRMDLIERLCSSCGKDANVRRESTHVSYDTAGDSNRVRKGSSNGEAHGERREALEERTCMLPTIIEKSLNTRRGISTPGARTRVAPISC